MRPAYPSQSEQYTGFLRNTLICAQPTREGYGAAETSDFALQSLPWWHTRNQPACSRYASSCIRKHVAAKYLLLMFARQFALIIGKSLDGLYPATVFVFRTAFREIPECPIDLRDSIRWSEREEQDVWGRRPPSDNRQTMCCSRNFMEF